MIGREGMRRIQVGAIGIIAIFCLLTIASAILSHLRTDPPKSIGNVSARPVEKPSEPLAKLGIAPADVQSNQAATANMAAPH